MSGAKAIGGAALAALLLGAPGCAATGPVGARPVAMASLEPSAAVTAIGGPTAAGGGLRREFMGAPKPGAMLAIGALLLLASPVLLLFVLVSTPVRALSRG